MVWMFERSAARLMSEAATTTAHAAPNRAKYQVKFIGLLNIPFLPAHLADRYQCPERPTASRSKARQPKNPICRQFSWSLRLRREAPRSRTPEQRDEVPPPHVEPPLPEVGPPHVQLATGSSQADLNWSD